MSQTVQSPRVVEMEAFMIVGVTGFTSMEDNQFPRLWDEYLARRAEVLDVRQPMVEIGLCLMGEEYAETGRFNAMVGAVVESAEALPEGMERYTIPAGLYAVFTHRGAFFPDGLPKTYQFVHQEWLPNSEYQPSGNFDFEWYVDGRFKGVDHPETEIDIYVPVVKKG